MVTNEINILRNLQHKNIVKYIDHSDGGKSIEINTKGQGYILSIRYLTTEYCEVSKKLYFSFNFLNTIN